MKKTRKLLLAMVSMILASMFLSGCEKRTNWGIGPGGIERKERWVITIPNQ